MRHALTDRFPKPAIDLAPRLAVGSEAFKEQMVKLGDGLLRLRLRSLSADLPPPHR
jgi:hypothetical protein